MEVFGTYKETIFRNEATGFTIFKLELSDFIPEFESRIITCKGELSFSFLCLPLKITGTKQISSYGEELEVESVEPCVKGEKEAIDFLSSECCKGISEKLAQKIIDAIGTDIFSLPDNPDAYSILTKVDGIGPGKAKAIINVLNQAKHQKDLLEYIKKFGGNFVTTEKILMKFGINALKELDRNPYNVGLNCGMDFLACDMMAKDKGFTVNSIERVEALVLSIINRDYQSGNAYMTLDRLIKNADYISKKRSAFTGSTISTYQIVSACDNLKDIRVDISNDEIRYYLEKSYEDEIKTAKNIERFQKNKKKNNININRIICICERELGIKYSDKQKECFNFLRSNGIKVITGGPGTGKSTVINGLTYAYHKLYPDNNIVMMAPTGRAAQRINEITGHEAGTIHRMLGICPFGNDGRIQTNYYADYPADMIVVDESSMIDNELMGALTDSLQSNCLLIMVGDIDQLPSIGAGSVLRDMITAKIETVKLDVNYRQKGKATIIDNATTINNGASNLITNDEFVIQQFYSPESLADAAKKTFISLYDKKNPYSVQILCPQNKGKAGTYMLNKNIQSELNKRGAFIANSYAHFKIGDKVMATKNNYEEDYFNGDVGLITDATEVTFTVNFNSRTLIIPRENIEDFQLAYACTIHKSQGSEYDTIIVCLPKEADGMIKRNLLYTAVTRAKKKVYILTQNGCIQSAVKRTTTQSRASGLADRILNSTKNRE